MDGVEGRESRVVAFSRDFFVRNRPTTNLALRLRRLRTYHTYVTKLVHKPVVSPLSANFQMTTSI